MSWLLILIKVCYFIVVVLFILGFKCMSLLCIVCGGIVWVGYGMLLVVLVIFVLLDIYNWVLIGVVVLLGVFVVWWIGKCVVMIDML